MLVLLFQDFEARKRLLYERSNQKHALPKQLASLDKDFSKLPFLQVYFHFYIHFTMEEVNHCCVVVVS